MGAGRGSTEVSGLPRVDIVGPRGALAIVQRAADADYSLSAPKTNCAR